MVPIYLHPTYQLQAFFLSYDLQYGLLWSKIKKNMTNKAKAEELLEFIKNPEPVGYKKYQGGFIVDKDFIINFELWRLIKAGLAMYKDGKYFATEKGMKQSL